ncbi:MAG: hypothetical protein Q9163_001436 [Psora crenata]
MLMDPKTNSQYPAFPLAAIFWPAKRAPSQLIVLPLLLAIVGLFRWCTGFWGYSGFQKPPMFGDYEAQRHWMEITTQVPISQWYLYDLDYWGLDYPPLTAYHSWLLGKMGSFINSAWFALYSSRGVEQQSLKVYMRATVIASEYLVYVPAAIILNRKLGHLSSINKWESSMALAAILMQPATILIDHAHFQFNTVMLGFVLASISSALSERYLWSCIFFVAALSFKQMALYFAPAIFAYLLGVCMGPRFRPSRLIGITVTTIITFALVMAPLLLGGLYDKYRGINPPLSTADRPINPLLSLMTPYINLEASYYPILLQLTQMVHRIFPFARGLFEDKVANIWCCIHTLHKLHEYPIPLLQRISFSATFIAILPSCMIISLFPHRNLLPWAMASSAWGFFLCSFQVHEKSVLLPLLPMTILLGGHGGLGVEVRCWVGWANLLGVWTLFPLLKKDELRVPYFVLAGLWTYLLGLPPTSLSCYFGQQASGPAMKVSTKFLHLAFYGLMILWHVVEAFVQPPKGKPHLWVVLNVIVGTAGFSVCYLWCTWQLILRSDILEEWFRYRQDQESKTIQERAKALPLPWPLSKADSSLKDHSPSHDPKKKRSGRPLLEAKEASNEPSPSPEKRKARRPRKRQEEAST